MFVSRGNVWIEISIHAVMPYGSSFILDLVNLNYNRIKVSQISCCVACCLGAFRWKVYKQNFACAMSRAVPDVQYARKQLNDILYLAFCISSLVKKVKRSNRYLVISRVTRVTIPFKYTCLRNFLSKVIRRHYERSRKRDKSVAFPCGVATNM